MKKTAVEMVSYQADEMAGCGYWQGVLAARWAEVAIEERQDDQAVAIYWQLRQQLGMR